MSNARIDGIVETCLYSNDLVRSTRFYRDVLALNLLESGERMSVFAVAPQQVLLLFHESGEPRPIPTPGGVIPPHKAAGQLHIAFAIAKDNFAAWESRLAAHGVPIESKVRWPLGGESLYFRDPDHHLIELATPGIWPVY